MQKIEPERLFSFTWHPYAVEPGTDYSKETPTLVEFTLEKTATGTRLRVVEFGFDKLPAHRRDTAFRATARAGRSRCRTSPSISSNMPSAAAVLRTRASVFAALGDETRLGLLAKLTNGEPLSIARLTEGTKLTRQAVTKHLRVLEDVGVVSRSRPAAKAASPSIPGRS